MRLGRRDFLSVAGVAVTLPLLDPSWRRRPASAEVAGLDRASLYALASAALAEAERLGCDHAQALISRRRTASSGAVDVGLVIHVVRGAGRGSAEGAVRGLAGVEQVVRSAVTQVRGPHPLAGGQSPGTAGRAARDSLELSDAHRRDFRRAARHRRPGEDVVGVETCARTSDGQLGRTATVTFN